MRPMRLEKCIKLLALMYSGGRPDEKAQAKALGVSKATVGRCRRNIREARMLRPLLPVAEGRGEGPRGRVSPIEESPRPRRARLRKSTPLPSVARGSPSPGETGRGRNAGQADRGRHGYLARLIHCDYLLALEYSGWRGDVHELARMLGVSERTILRELHLIEAVLGRALQLVRRRKNGRISISMNVAN